MGYLLRLFLLALVIWLAWRFVQGLLKPPKTHSVTRGSESTDMVACAHCGLHVPRDEAVFHHSTPYCCQAHADADRVK
jgi:uncharacterized protein